MSQWAAEKKGVSVQSRATIRSLGDRSTNRTSFSKIFETCTSSRSDLMTFRLKFCSRHACFSSIFSFSSRLNPFSTVHFAQHPLPIDKHHQESFWRGNLQIGGNLGKTTPTGLEPKEPATVSRIHRITFSYHDSQEGFFRARSPSSVHRRSEGIWRK